VRSCWLLVAACSYQPVRQDGDVVADSAPVGIDAEVVADADPPVDAFVPARDCPSGYDVVIAGQTSRYRVITTGRRSWEHGDDCIDDELGHTHLVAIDDQAELDGIEALVDATGNLASNKAWIGGVQLRGQATPADGWLAVTGGPLLAIFNPGEPNDNGGTEDNQENFVGLERGRQGLVDFPNNDNLGAICECDGKPVHPQAAAAVEANRQ
jgi:hypothetical protein